MVVKTCKLIIIYMPSCTSWSISLCLVFFLGVIPFAGGSYLAYGILDSSIAKPPVDHTPTYMFISGCLAAAVAKVTFLDHAMFLLLGDCGSSMYYTYT